MGLTSGSVYPTYRAACSDLAAARQLATQIAHNQTIGYTPSADEGWLSEYIAQVADVKPAAGSSHEYDLQLAFPAHLFKQDIAGLLTVIFGKISFSPGLKLTSLTGDESFLRQFSGAKFGFEGLARLVGRTTGPLLMAILKPGIGPRLEVLASQFAQLAAGGVHFVKDDEICIDEDCEVALRRLDAIQKVRANQTVYVVNLTGRAFALREQALRLQAAGAQAFLFNAYTYGIGLLQALCNDPEIKTPVFVHPALSAPTLSQVSPAVFLGTVPRLCGADAVLYPSPYGSIALSMADAQALHQELTRPMSDFQALGSVPSAGITLREVEPILNDFGAQVIINAGTGIGKGANDLKQGSELFLKKMGVA